MSKHGGCFACGGGDNEILKSMLIVVEQRNGNREQQPAALCAKCVRVFLETGVVRRVPIGTPIQL